MINKLLKREYPYSEPEWTAENQNRKQGETTFKQCGWCDHASCGSVRYNCYLHSSCSLLKKYGIGEDVYWDTNCLINIIGIEDSKSVINYKMYDIKQLNEQIARVQKQIKILKNIPFDKKPPLPENRVSNYYNLGDIVWIYFENKWNRGTVVKGYRHHGGCVSYVLDDYEASKEGWGCGTASSCILKDWEFKFFKNNNESFEKWLSLCNEDESLLTDLYNAIVI